MIELNSTITCPAAVIPTSQWSSQTLQERFHATKTQSGYRADRRWLPYHASGYRNGRKATLVDPGQHH
jgi:hypothetical protein